MTIHKFPGFDNKALTLYSHYSHLGTGGVKSRVGVIGVLDDGYFEDMDKGGLQHDISGCLDAPDVLPSGATVRIERTAAYIVKTQPGSVHR